MIHAGNDADWFYIKSIGNGNVISVAASDAFLRSQVYVRPPRQNDEELWRWDGQFLVNKATNLVMDIRKGVCNRRSSEVSVCLLFHADQKPT